MLEHFSSDNTINKICELYPKEQEKKEKDRQKKEGTISEFGMSGIKVLPLIQKPAFLYIEGLWGKSKV